MPLQLGNQCLEFYNVLLNVCYMFMGESVINYVLTIFLSTYYVPSIV